MSAVAPAGHDERRGDHLPSEQRQSDTTDPRNRSVLAVGVDDFATALFPQPQTLNHVGRQDKHRGTRVDERLDLDRPHLLRPQIATVNSILVVAVGQFDRLHDLPDAASSVGGASGCQSVK